MHAKAIAGSYQRTGCDTVKTMANLIAAGFVTTDGGPINSAKYARIQAEAQALRYTLDGTTPTASLGHTIAVGAQITLTPRELRDIKVIGAAAGGFANTTLFSA